MSNSVDVTMTVNGTVVNQRVAARTSLADFLRNQLELTGTHVGCEHGVCGACTVRMNGDTVRACLILAVQAEGAEIQTIEGLTASGEAARLQLAFHERNALQCGFCTPGMLMSASELLKRNPHPGREQIREYLSGNFCRCTGYHAIVDAIEIAARDPER